MRPAVRSGILALGAVVGVVAGMRAAPAPAAGAEPAPKARTLRLPETPYRYADPELPAHFQARAVRDLDNTPRDNPTTDAGAALGRALFYDTRLSASGTVACASCHHQKHAFSDPAGKFSKGHAGGHTDRNAMPLVEARFYARGRFFWDERARTLEEQVLMPVQNKVEMGHAWPKVVEALAADAAYPGLYAKAFGDPKVTTDRSARALAQFVRALLSYRSKYDEGVAKVRSRNEDFPNFTREENRGRAVFMQRCATCHMPGQQDAVFSDQAPQNTGLDADLKVADLGVADVTFDRNRAGAFKSPSLRNIEHTGPYMHDGRFAKLEDVIEHYSSGIKSHPNLDGRLRNLGGPPGGGRQTRGFQFTAAEKAALVAFLKTLSDPQFLTDPKFSDPFVSR
ncbi:MAG TPA: cytochrome c peroxidase [Urbifossiella sp.]|nr:cytochrome c peroxidase [Urbifossiella sp.]